MSIFKEDPLEFVENVDELTIKTPWDALYYWEIAMEDFKNPEVMYDLYIRADQVLYFVFGLKKDKIPFLFRRLWREEPNVQEFLVDELAEIINQMYDENAVNFLLFIYRPGKVRLSTNCNDESVRDVLFMKIIPELLSEEGFNLVDILQMSDTDVSSYHAQGFIEQPLLMEIGNQSVNYDRPYRL